MSGIVKTLLLAIFAMVLAGCGGSSSPTSILGSLSAPTVKVTFVGSPPSAVATQIGSGPFTSASLSASNTLGLNLPSGTTSYAVAYLCTSIKSVGPGAFVTVSSESVIEATVQDATKLTLGCSPPLGPPVVAEHVEVDTSALPGANEVLGYGSNGLQALLLAPSGLLIFSAPTGTEDLAVLVQDASLNVLGVKIIRSQSIPGNINGGNTLVFGPQDTITMQPFTVDNAPAGSNLLFFNLSYNTANGTTVPLGILDAFHNTVSGSYPAVPGAATQNGDFYLYDAQILDLSNQTVEIIETTTTGGGPVTLTLPSAWSFSGPQAAAFPIFTFNYPGFSGLPVAIETAGLVWGMFQENSLNLTATANFQQGTNTITIPNLSSLSGFLGPASSGMQVFWSASIMGGNGLSVSNPKFPSSANALVAVVANKGSFVEP